MKRMVWSFFLLMFSIFCVSSTNAQTRYTDAGARSKFSVGLGVLPGISLPIGKLDDEDAAALGFALRAGLNVTYPFSTEMAAFFNAGLDIRNPGIKEDSLLDSRYYSVTYFAIQPGISYSSIGLSLLVGIPMSGSEPVPRVPGQDVAVDATQDVPKDVLEMLIEPRLSGTLALMDEEAYWLGLDISVGLPLTKLYKEEYQRSEEDDGSGRTLVPATSPLSVNLGLTFQFGLFDTF